MTASHRGARVRMGYREYVMGMSHGLVLREVRQLVAFTLSYVYSVIFIEEVNVSYLLVTMCFDFYLESPIHNNVKALQ